MKTYQPKHKDIYRNWHLIDAKNKVLGRMSTEIATKLTGKHKAQYSDHMDMGDYVVVINADKLVLTGRKSENKVYHKHSGYPGGYREIKFAKLFNEQPEKVVRKAVYGMLPDNRLKKNRLSRLKIFAGEKHIYQDKFKSEVKDEKQK